MIENKKMKQFIIDNKLSASKILKSFPQIRNVLPEDVDELKQDILNVKEEFQPVNLENAIKILNEKHFEKKHFERIISTLENDPQFLYLESEAITKDFTTLMNYLLDRIGNILVENPDNKVFDMGKVISDKLEKNMEEIRDILLPENIEGKDVEDIILNVQTKIENFNEELSRYTDQIKDLEKQTEEGNDIISKKLDEYYNLLVNIELEPKVIEKEVIVEKIVEKEVKVAQEEKSNIVIDNSDLENKIDELINLNKQVAIHLIPKLDEINHNITNTSILGKKSAYEKPDNIYLSKDYILFKVNDGM